MGLLPVKIVVSFATGHWPLAVPQTTQGNPIESIHILCLVMT